MEEERGHHGQQFNVNFTFEIGELLADTLKAIFIPPVIQKPEEIKIMANYVVKDDNADVGVKVTASGALDAEGNPIPDAQLTIAISSTDDAVVQATDNGDGSGNVHFGAPGQASLQYSVSDANGKLLGSGSDGFTVTTGDPASVASVSATFDGLTPAPDTPPAA